MKLGLPAALLFTLSLGPVNAQLEPLDGGGPAAMLVSVSRTDPICATCLSWSGGTHDFYASEYCDYGSGNHCFQCQSEFSCYEEIQYAGYCPQHHMWCGMTFDSEGFELALANSDADALAAHLADSSESVRLNERRQLIQIFDCKGVIVAQYPVTADLMNAVSSADSD